MNKRIIVLLLAFAMIFTSFGQISFAKNNTSEEYKGLSEAIQNRERPTHQRSKISDSLKKEIAAAKLKEKNENPEERLRVIVELEEAPVILEAKSSRQSDVKAVADKARSKVKKAEIRVKSQMRAKDIDFEDIYSLDTFVSGFSIYTKRKNIEAIKNIDGVKNVQISEKYSLPKPEQGDKPQMYASVNMIGAPKVWNTGYKGEGQVVAVLDTGFDANNIDSFRLDDKAKDKIALTKARVNELKSKYGLQGAYLNEKIPYIYNYQDETADPDALQDRYGSRHGLHVAGTIGANEKEGYKNPNRLVDDPIRGVAPNAQLIIMKVFSTSLTDSSTYSDTQCKAIEDSYKLGADAMNLSLGSPAGFVNNDDIVQVAFQNAIKAGCLVAVANGNEGTAYTDGTLPIKALEGNPDYGMAGTPANGWATTSVAAITNTNLMAYSMDSNNDDIKGIRFSWGVGLNVKKSVFNKFVYAELGREEDFANLNKDDVTGALAIVRRGGNSFGEKAANAEAAGAIGLLVINRDEEDAFGMSGIENLDFPVALVGKTNGDNILKHIDDEGFTLTYMDKESKQDNPNAGKMASFTSWGPTPVLTMKPELTAPGADIYSIDQDNKYQVMSGTSMATPHVAGAAAIVAQFLKDENTVFYKEAQDPAARQVLNKTLLMNTAIPQKDVETYYPVRRQGAGLIDLENLVKAKVTVKATSKNDRDLDAKAELKSFDDKEFTINFELENYSNEDIEYTLEPSMMTEKFVFDPDLGPMTTETDRNMNFTVDKKTVKAAKNNTTKFSVTFNFENDDINRNNYVEGFLRFIPKDAEKEATLTVPYLGFYGDWSKPRIFDVFSHEWDEIQAPNYINLNTNDSMGDVFDFTDSADGDSKDAKVNHFIYNDKWVYITSHSSSAALKIRYALLRNTEYIKASIKEENGELLKDNVTNLSYYRKSRAVEGNGENWISIYKDAFKADALNNIVLKGKLNTEEGVTQEVTVPVYFDDNKPTLKAELIEENDSKYAKITLSDDIGIDVIGVQQGQQVDVDKKGNPIYNYHKFNEVGGLYYGNTKFNTEDDNRKTAQDDKVINSLTELKGSNEEKVVYIKVDDIADIEKLSVYTKDLAGNWANAMLDTDYSSDGTIDLRLIGENLKYWIEAGEAIEENETIKIKKGTYGELQIVLPDDGKTYEIESALINNEEIDPAKFDYAQDDRVFYMPYRFDEDTTFSAKIVEVAPEPPAPEPTFPEGNGYPSIFLIQPENQWTVSENSKLNPQDSPEIEDGMLNVFGAVGFTKPEELKSITLKLIDNVNKKVISTKNLDLNNKDEVFVDVTGEVKNGNEVVYDGLAVFFDTAIELPKGYSNIKLQVEAVKAGDKEDPSARDKKTVTSVTLAVDASPATLNYTITKRKLTDATATINFILTDDNKNTEMYVDRINDINNSFIQTVYTKVYDKWDIDTSDSTRYLYKDKFTVDLKPGFNKFKVYLYEGGTARQNVRYIMIYRLADGRAKLINN